MVQPNMFLLGAAAGDEALSGRIELNVANGCAVRVLPLVQTDNTQAHTDTTHGMSQPRSLSAG